MPEFVFLQPLDVLYLRGNRLFGAPGAHGESLMPPWPSLLAGALRSHLLAQAGVNVGAFGRGECRAEGELGDCLGTPQRPGTFRLAGLWLARRNGQIEPLLPCPADLFVGDNEVRYLRPSAAAGEEMQTSAPLAHCATLVAPKPGKPKTGLWLTGGGVGQYLRGAPLAAGDLIESRQLWRSDARVGIALDPGSRAAAKGKIYSTDAVAPAKDVGFLVALEGCPAGHFNPGLVRLGGDGRAAALQPCSASPPGPDLPRLSAEKRFRLALLTPGLFAGGWLPPQIECRDGECLWRGNGFKARLLAAAVPRAVVISGWDLAQRRPKPARRAAPAGSVYWFDQFEGDPAALAATVASGLWGGEPDPAADDRSRWAEGFNNALLANWETSAA